MEKMKGIVENVKFQNGRMVAVVDVDCGEDWFAIKIVRGKFIKGQFRYEDDKEAAEKAEKICQKAFGLSFDDLKNLKNREVDVYYQPGSGKAYFTEPDWPIAFEETIDPFTAKIDRVHVGDDKITVHFNDPDGIHRALFYKWTEWRDGEPKKSRTKKDRQFKAFKEAFGCSPEEGGSLIGREIEIEVASTNLNGKTYYFTKLAEGSASKKAIGNVKDMTAEAVNEDNIPY